VALSLDAFVTIPDRAIIIVALSLTKMAFDQAMEADRIDDFGLFSAIVHAPLWILGSVLGSGKGRSGSRCHDDNEKASSHQPDDNTDSSWRSQTCSHNSASGEIESSSSNNPLMRARVVQLKQANSIDASPRRSPTSSMDIFNSSTDTGELHGLVRTKKMSWSDESGHCLVEYADEVSYFMKMLFTWLCVVRNWFFQLLFLVLPSIFRAAFT
jgi:hypothetical protein